MCSCQGYFLPVELSSQEQQLTEGNFKGRCPAEAFTGTKIDLTGKSGEASGIENLQVGGFGAVFADEPIAVLIRPAHPGRVRRRKEKGTLFSTAEVSSCLSNSLPRSGVTERKGVCPLSQYFFILLHLHCKLKVYQQRWFARLRASMHSPLDSKGAERYNAS